MKDRTTFIAALALFVIPLIFFPNLDETFVLPKRFFMFLFVALLFLEVAFTVQKEDEGISLDLPNLLVIAFITITGIAVWLSPNPLIGRDYFLDVFCLGMFFLFFRTYLDEGGIRNAAMFLFLAAVVTSIYALIQHLGLDPVSWDHPEMVLNRSIGTMANPDFLAGLLALVFPMGLGLIFTTGQGWKVRLGLIGLGLIMLAALLTYCRGGWLAMIAGSVVLFAGMGLPALKKNWTRIVAVLVIFIVVLGAAWTYEKIFHKGPESITGRVVSALRHDVSVSTRTYLWGNALLLIKDRPLTGWGPGFYPFASLKYRNLEPVGLRSRIAMPESSHNEYLDIAVNGGLPALLIFLGLLFMAFRGAYRKMKTGEKEKIFYAGMMGALAAFSVHVFFVYSTPGLSLAFWFTMAACIALNTGARRMTPYIFKLASSLILLACMVIMYFLFQNVHADYLYKLGLNQAEEGKRVEALKSVERAIEIYPFKPDYLRVRGKMLEVFLHEKYDPNLAKAGILSYGELIRSNPYDPYSHADLGRLFSYIALSGVPGMRKYGIESYREAVTLDEYNNFFHNDLANVYMADGNYMEALKHYKRSIELYPYNAGVYTNLGLCYKQLGDMKKAREFFMKALEMEPNYKKAKDLLERIGSGGK
ncbi:MAG: O-antigen ligase family protein [Chloroflexi bacterium]|nr:O-antigen ligase family protein [Chloroflexota bacterium]